MSNNGGFGFPEPTGGAGGRFPVVDSGVRGSFVAENPAPFSDPYPDVEPPAGASQAEQMRHQKLQKMKALELLRQRQRRTTQGAVVATNRSMMEELDSTTDLGSSTMAASSPTNTSMMFAPANQSQNFVPTSFNAPPQQPVQHGQNRQPLMLDESVFGSAASDNNAPAGNALILDDSRRMWAQPPQMRTPALAAPIMGDNGSANPSNTNSNPAASREVFNPQNTLPQNPPPSNNSGPSSSKLEKELQDRGITPCFDPARQTPLAAFLSSEREFLMKATPPGTLLQCYIKRFKKSNFSKAKYEMFLFDNDVFIMSARKRNNKTASNYIISTSQTDLSRTSSAFFGKLRSNFVGTEFFVYDDGFNVDRRTGSGSDKVRRELSCILYQQNVLGVKGPRRLTVVLPMPKADGTYTEFRPVKSSESMLEVYKRGVTQVEKQHTGNQPAQFNGNDRILVMRNRPPKWNAQLGAYVLNFNGRVTMASVKNFQLSYQQDGAAESVVLQFGRVGKDEFNLDFKWPISPMQAFGIALSSFDNKLLCE